MDLSYCNNFDFENLKYLPKIEYFKFRTKKPIIIPLPSDLSKLEALFESSHLIGGWRNSKSMLQEIENQKTFNFIAR